MFTKSSTIALAITVLTTSAAAPAALAQNFQNWLTNEANKIQRDRSQGLLTPSQLSQLQAREAQIQAEQQALLNRNGGVIPPGQGRGIANELRRLNSSLNKDLARNGGYNNGMLAPSMGYNNGGGFFRNLFGGTSYNNYQYPYNAGQVNYTGAPYGSCTGNMGNSAWLNGSNVPWHHHHHHFNNASFGQGIFGGSGFNNGFGPFAHRFYPGNSAFGLSGGNGNHWGWGRCRSHG